MLFLATIEYINVRSHCLWKAKGSLQLAYATARAAHEAGLATEFGVLVLTFFFGCASMC